MVRIRNVGMGMLRTGNCGIVVPHNTYIPPVQVKQVFFIMPDLTGYDYGWANSISTPWLDLGCKKQTAPANPARGC